MVRPHLIPPQAESSLERVIVAGAGCGLPRSCSSAAASAVGSPGGELLKQDILGRVRTPLEKREAIVEAFKLADFA